jgi:hypothetical protein
MITIRDINDEAAYSQESMLIIRLVVRDSKRPRFSVRGRRGTEKSSEIKQTLAEPEMIMRRLYHHILTQSALELMIHSR